MSTLSPDARTLSPLPPVLHHGLPAVTLFGSLSFLLSSTLFLLLTYRLISWRRKSGSQESTNQFFVLLYNLLLADIQQGLAFLLNGVALHRNSIRVGSSTCWAQGWFVSTGDLASSVFILAIALHTFMGVVKSYKLPSWAFYTGIGGLWTFIYGLAIIGAVMHPKDIYVRANAWVCFFPPISISHDPKLCTIRIFTEADKYSAGSIPLIKMNAFICTTSGFSSACSALSSFTDSSSTRSNRAHLLAPLYFCHPLRRIQPNLCPYPFPTLLHL
jgi:hypothetical protein